MLVGWGKRPSCRVSFLSGFPALGGPSWRARMLKAPSPARSVEHAWNASTPSMCLSSWRSRTLSPASVLAWLSSSSIYSLSRRAGKSVYSIMIGHDKSLLELGRACLVSRFSNLNSLNPPWFVLCIAHPLPCCQDEHFSPVAISLLQTAYPLVIAGFMKITERLAKPLGRPQFGSHGA